MQRFYDSTFNGGAKYEMLCILQPRQTLYIQVQRVFGGTGNESMQSEVETCLCRPAAHRFSWELDSCRSKDVCDRTSVSVDL